MEETFNKRMAEFQKDLQNASSSPTAGPHSQLRTEFAAFRSLVLAQLHSLQAQVDLLMKISDEQEMRSRRKFLLLHGVAEDKNEKPSSIVELLSNHLGIPDLADDVISRCHRIGLLKEDKPRPILIKFCDIHTKNNVWASKAKLKGSGITLSEFLTKRRHEIFMAARKRHGISRCWTRGGQIVVIAPDGSRHRVECMDDVVAIPVQENQAPQHSSESTLDHKVSKVARPRRLQTSKIK
ncbi:unnamed protein product [Colias eurytheme]|nr:unnamed protein product [Colias eurytheme]CAG4975880.1 unnamed protein product [Colias eurytheme]